MTEPDLRTPFARRLDAEHARLQAILAPFHSFCDHLAALEGFLRQTTNPSPRRCPNCDVPDVDLRHAMRILKGKETGGDYS